MKFFLVTFAILSFSFVLYQAFVVVPIKKIELQETNKKNQEDITTQKKEELLREYEQCKDHSTIKANLEWLKQCDSITPLKEDCKKIITGDYPWDLHYLAHRYPEDDDSPSSRQKFKEYSAFRTKFSECNCETLPINIADDINNLVKEEKSNCLKEFEAKSKILL